MSRIGLLFILSWSVTGCAATANALKPGRPSVVRVRVLQNAREVEIDQSGQKLPGDHVVCRGSSVIFQSIKAGPGVKRSVFLSPYLIPSDGQQKVRVNRVTYRGKIEVVARGNLCEVINHVELESYLKAVVNSEMSSKWSDDALAAQIVAARTYALYQVGIALSKASHFDLDATEKDQMYEGSDKESARSSQLVDGTRGWVLTTVRDDQAYPIKAFYHSTCGGETELPERVWGDSQPGLKKRVACPFCRNSPVYSWQVALTASELARAVSAGLSLTGPPRDWPQLPSRLFQSENLLEIRPLGLSGGGRPSEILMVWQGQFARFNLKISAARFREWVGFSRLPSTWFEIMPQPPALVGLVWLFRGRGRGHGVGMCQWGVREMGLRGYSYASILKHYYPDANLTKLW